MDPPTTQEASQESSSSPSDNPLVAVGRKVKSAFSTDQQPSVRIIRSGPSNRQSQATPPDAQSTSVNEKTPSKGFFGSLFGRKDESTATSRQNDNEYDADTVDMLDVIDPEVSTLSTLTNVQNSLFVPQLGGMVNRRATYRLQETPEEERRIDRLKNSLKQLQSSTVDKIKGALGRPVTMKRSNSITSQLKESRYAVLPHGVTLDGWSEADKEELDDMVRHMLHSRRSKFKRSMRGFWQYVRRPLGLFVTVYATLITLFGAAWVLFLIGWISLGSKKDYIINIIDNVLVALFAIMGDGLAPFRAVDTYHMIYIAKYHRKTWKKREQMGLPDLVDRNDLPDQTKEQAQAEPDLESLVARKVPRGFARRVAPKMPKRVKEQIISRHMKENPTYEYTVLTEEEQAKLEHHERKFSKSHTFYKPHETETHYAFPLKLLVAIVILLDLHSCLQITLGVCTWSMEKSRPFALTTVILCCSITCNITGGVLISIGDKRTRKKEVLERMYRQELTSEAMETIETRWLKEAEERGEIDPRIREQREQAKEDEENEQIKKEWKAVPLLPKKLLGKGEDHRQPSLPQKEKRSNSNNLEGKAKSDQGASKKTKDKDGATLPPLREGAALNQAQQGRDAADEESKESTGQKVLRMFRRADGDQS